MFVRIPARDWSFVVSGKQTEFRVSVGNVAAAYGFEHIELPLPLFVVGYRTRPEVKRLLTLERIRRERLIEIDEDGLRRAGYTGEDAFDRFRRDWMLAEKKRFEPQREVVVFTVRPPAPGDREIVGANLLAHLYGDHLADL